MVDLRSNPVRPRQAFATRRRGESEPSLRPREKLKLALLVGVTLAFVAIWLGHWASTRTGGADGGRRDATRDREPLPRMDIPDLERAGSLPTYDEIKAQAPNIAFLRRNEQDPHFFLSGLELPSIAWARSQILDDRDDPPLVQSFSSEDFVRDRVRHGKAVLVTGSLVDYREDRIAGSGDDPDEVWYRLTLLLPHGEQGGEAEKPLFMHVLAPEWATPERADGGDGFTIGLALHVVGRYLGLAELPDVAGDTEKVPVVVASSVAHRQETDVESFLHLGALPEPAPDGRLVPDESIFDDLDDVRPVLETKPYYYLLGLVKYDLGVPSAYDEAVDITAITREIHQEPHRFRARPVTVQGTVLDAWEDVQVAQAEPYGVQRVFRIWVWRIVHRLGQQPFHDLYELAVIVTDADRELPRVGDRVAATGRFFKWHGYRVDQHPLQAVVDDAPERYSDTTYFKMVVAPDFTLFPEPEPPDWSVLKVVFLVLALTFAVGMGFLISREHRGHDRYKEPMRRLRATRRKLRERQRAGGETPEAEEPSSGNAEGEQPASGAEGTGPTEEAAGDAVEKPDAPGADDGAGPGATPDRVSEPADEAPVEPGSDRPADEGPAPDEAGDRDERERDEKE